MQHKARTRYQPTAALVVIVVAATLTALLIGLFGRTAEPGAQITDGTSNTGVAVTDGWMHNEFLNPTVNRGVDVTDGWMHNEILNPPVSRGVDVTDGWMHNEILNPPRQPRRRRHRRLDAQRDPQPARRVRRMAGSARPVTPARKSDRHRVASSIRWRFWACRRHTSRD